MEIKTKMKHKYLIEGVHVKNRSEVKRLIEQIEQITDVDIDAENKFAIISMGDHVQTDTISDKTKQIDGFKISMDVDSVINGEGKESVWKELRPLFIIIFFIIILTSMFTAYHSGDVFYWLRIFMSIFFIVFGILKLIKLKDFARTYATYDLLAAKSKIYAMAYPFIEIGLGVLLFLNLFTVYVNVFVIIIMSVGSLGVFKKLKSGVKIECACLGTLFKVPMTWVTLAEDLLMVFMALFMLASSFQTYSQKQNMPEKNLKYSVKEFLAYPLESKTALEVKEFTVEAKEGEFSFFPNVETKLWMYNNKIAPVLKVTKGQKIKVTFKNRLNQHSTIHWHGVRLPNQMDGVPVLTQKSVKPGSDFVYEFTPKDAGTFWFHPHVKTSQQMGRGLYGILIVKDREELPYSKDIVWALDDWRLGQDGQIQESFGNSHDMMMNGRQGNVITVNGEVSPALDLKPGERVRLRVVNTSNARIYNLDLGDIAAKVIAIDGMYVKEAFDYKGFYLAPGNRIDFDIQIPLNFKKEEVLIRDSISTGAGVARINILKQKDLEKYNFDFPGNKNIPDLESFLDKKVDVTYNLDFTGGMMNGRWTINGKVFGDDAPKVYKKNKYYKIRFNNLSAGVHPMHVHGQFFKVISRSGDRKGEEFFRDTIFVKPHEFVDVVMYTSDSGKWANHCHILEHAESAMMTSIIVE